MCVKASDSSEDALGDLLACDYSDDDSPESGPSDLTVVTESSAGSEDESGALTVFMVAECLETNIVNKTAV